MSPHGPPPLPTPRRFPRVSGDEPLNELPLDDWKRFSPRERG